MARCFMLVVSALIAFAVIGGQRLYAEAEVVATRVLAIDSCLGSIVVENADDYRLGDRVLLYQSYGATIDSSGNLLSLGTAGRWCLSTIRRIDERTITFADPLYVQLDPEYAVQAVRVINVERVVINSLTVPAFAHGIGGIVVIEADTVVLNGVVSAKGAGYRGGRRSLSTLDTSMTTAISTERIGNSGEIGASAHGRPLFGQRSVLNGGGGGNARNGGGGGGAGAGAGGLGGRQTSEFEPIDVGGRGGSVLRSTIVGQHLWMGGGGGGGHQNDFLGGDGGSGGGIVMIIAGVITSNDAVIDVSGDRGGDGEVDGAGGGGGGGSVMIRADSIRGMLTIRANGGDGGDVLSSLRCYGPGGGGGGGIVIADGVFTATSLLIDGGDPGTTRGRDAPCAHDTTYGATSGEGGAHIVSKVVLDGAGVPCEAPDVLVRTIDTAANIGEEAVIVVEVEPRASSLEQRMITVRLRLRATVAFPIGPYWWAGRRYTLRLINVAIPASSLEIERRIVKYQCLLGDSSSVIIGIDSAWADDDTTTVSIAHEGRLSVDDLCVRGERIRLFDPFSMMPMTYDVYDLQGRRIGTETEATAGSGYEGPWLRVRRSSTGRGPAP